MNIRIILDVSDIPGSVSINRIAAIDRVALTGHGRAAFDRHDVVIGISFPCLTAENTIDRAPAHGDLIGQNITGTVANSIDPDSDPAFYSAFDRVAFYIHRIMHGCAAAFRLSHTAAHNVRRS